MNDMLTCAMFFMWLLFELSLEWLLNAAYLYMYTFMWQTHWCSKTERNSNRKLLALSRSSRGPDGMALSQSLVKRNHSVEQCRLQYWDWKVADAGELYKWALAFALYMHFSCNRFRGIATDCDCGIFSHDVDINWICGRPPGSQICELN